MESYGTELHTYSSCTYHNCRWRCGQQCRQQQGQQGQVVTSLLPLLLPACHRWSGPVAATTSRQWKMEALQVSGRRRLCPGGVPPHSSAGGAARGPALRNVTRCLLLALSGPRSGSGPEEPGQGTGTRRTAATRTCTCTTAAVRARARWARSSSRCCK